MRTTLNSVAGRRVWVRGFTLIELLIVVTIIGLLLVIGVPAMGEFVADQRVRTVASDITSEIALARGKAIETSHRVIIQKLDANANWNNGWRLYADLNDNAAYDDGVDLELKRFDGFTSGNIYICTVPVFPNSQIIFRPDGRIVRTGVVNPNTDGIYVVDTLGDGNPLNDKIRGVQFGLSGRATVRKMNGLAIPCAAN